ncbi:MAG: GAF domain-containing protein [Candidatus Rokubacteria bacterium]|nr:GAF domain-containing protein [Candidatus Rokubacteria bacterium]
MPGEVNCIFTKVLIPYLERHVSPAAAALVCRAAGRSRDYLMADHNWLPLDQVVKLLRLGQELAGEPDEEAWHRRFWEFGMDWKPREERSYVGTYTMGIGDPRTVYARMDQFYGLIHRWARLSVVELRRALARMRVAPLPGYRAPRWGCVWLAVSLERFPTNWGLPRARVLETACATRGAPACEFEVRWRNPSLGIRFWAPTAGGVVLGLAGLLEALSPLPWPVPIALAALPAVSGAAVGYGLRERRRRRHTQRMLDLQSEEVIYSNHELEKKFRDLETKIEQLSLLIELSAAVNATLDPERIYDQALARLVSRMGYERAHLFLVDDRERVLRGFRMAGGEPEAAAEFARLELPLDPEASAAARVVATGRPVLVNDVETAAEPVHREAARAYRVRAFVTVPLRLKDRVFGVLSVSASAPDRFSGADVELLSAVTNHVALAVDRAESFRTIEELSRGLEEKVRVRTEQLQAANEELQAAYRDLQATQMQLIQREKMASVGQLVAGVAHELNNPIGFVSSNVSTLEDFLGRLRAILDAYRAADLPAPDRERIEARWRELKVDYALRYLDPMIQGIREGAERTRKIVRDLRVFARSGDEAWQAVDLHEELESSLTLLNHLLKDRITVHRKYGALPSVECVRSQVDQVFLNVLANAAQAITGPGEITIETRAEDGWAVVVIGDTGPGIPAEVIGRIFDPFFTTKQVGDGTGLGLSISYEIVKKHGGTIEAASPPGQGAVFTIRLPLHRRAS